MTRGGRLRYHKLIIMCDAGVEGVRVSGRSTQGVKLMDLGDDDHLVAVAKLAEREEQELTGDAEEEPPIS